MPGRGEQTRWGAALAFAALLSGGAAMADASIHRLPQAGPTGEAGLYNILRQRRSVRSFTPEPLSLAQVAQLLWAAQGISAAPDYRTAPSAGALYPLELHLLAGQVDGLAAGSYRYDPTRHALTDVTTDDLREALASAALNQDWVAEAPAVVVIGAVEARTTRKYGRRGIRYVLIEAGHAAQNLLLQAVALGLGGAVVGAFDDEQVQALLSMPGDERPLLILPVGHPR